VLQVAESVGGGNGKMKRRRKGRAQQLFHQPSARIAPTEEKGEKSIFLPSISRNLKGKEKKEINNQKMPFRIPLRLLSDRSSSRGKKKGNGSDYTGFPHRQGGKGSCRGERWTNVSLQHRRTVPTGGKKREKESWSPS